MSCRPADIEDSEYEEFYKSLTKDYDSPLAKVHFVAEGEVTFKSVLFVSKTQHQDSFNKYGKKTDNIKVRCLREYVNFVSTRRAFKKLTFCSSSFVTYYLMKTCT